MGKKTPRAQLPWLGGHLRGAECPGGCGSCRHAISGTSVPLLLFSLPLNTRPMGQAGAEPTVLKAATRAGPVPKMLTISRGPRTQQVKTRRFQSLHNRVWKERPGSTNCLQAASELSQEDQPLLRGQTNGEQSSGMGAQPAWTSALSLWGPIWQLKKFGARRSWV